MNLRILSSLTLKIAGGNWFEMNYREIVGKKNVTVHWKYVGINFALFF